MLIQMNCTEFNSRDLWSLHYVSTDRPASYKAAVWSPFEILRQTATGAQGSYTLLAR